MSPLRFSSRLPLLLAIVVLLVPVQGKRISELKCDEFIKETKTIHTMIPLIINPKPIVFESFNCSKTLDLIIGGENATVGEFPHQALLGYNKTDGTSGYDFLCGGSLISERFVLTAAHCMKERKPSIIRLGETDLTKESENEWDVGIEFIKRHPKHRFSAAYHDIALIKLNETITFSIVIRPACLWNLAALNETAPVVVTGFGKVDNYDYILSETLRKVQLNFLNRSECLKQYSGHHKFKQGILDSQLCIGNIRDGQSRDSCQGDSGGPVQIITEPKGCTYHVLGVTSIGPTGCGLGRSPTAYTRVSSYIDWIEKEVWGQ